MKTTSKTTYRNHLRGIPSWHSLFSTMALFSIACTIPAHALTNFTRNGVLWEGSFEGDTTALTTAGTPPTGTTPAWSTFDVSGGSTSTSGGIFTITTTTVAQRQSWSNTFGMTTSSLMTVEWLANVDTSVSSDSFGVGGVIVWANDRVLNFDMKSTGVSITQGGSEIGSVGSLDMSVDRTYRVTYDGSLSSDKWNLYFDGNTTAAWSSGSILGASSASVNKVVFGDYSAGAFFGKSNWDNIAWTDEGAYAPVVPEPSTAALALAAMGFSVIFSRFRRTLV
jgi:hypothetical protein